MKILKFLIGKIIYSFILIGSGYGIRSGYPRIFSIVAFSATIGLLTLSMINRNQLVIEDNPISYGGREI
jgi:hypothetical protein